MSGHSPDSVGYVMSCSQLNELWHYDFWLANVLMDLPMRSCTATPKELPEYFAPMNPTDFQKLKDQVRAMWISASYIFKCQKGDYGWGLFVSEDFDKNSRIFTDKKPLVAGWLARVPSAAMCPTGHRYLRSPCDNEEFSIYLGGPISLANFDEVDMVSCKRLISNNEPFRNMLRMYKAPRRKLGCGQEVLWSYNLSAADKSKPNFHPVNEWQLDSCCLEVEQHVAFSMPLSGKQDKPSSKKRKVGGCRPHKTAVGVTSYKFCTYCGFNVLEKGKRDNMKRHWALKHSLSLCEEMKVDVDEEDEPVSAKDFVKHLDKVDHVYNTLNHLNYKVVPACNFFDIMDTPLPPPEANDEERERIYLDFLEEGKSAFRKYQVLYLKGISMPEKYGDLLKPDKTSNFSDINWHGLRPSNTNFSLVAYALTENENHEHALDIKKQVMNAVLAWMR